MLCKELENLVHQLLEVYPAVAHDEISMRDWFCRDTEINELFFTRRV